MSSLSNCPASLSSAPSSPSLSPHTLCSTTNGAKRGKLQAYFRSASLSLVLIYPIAADTQMFRVIVPVTVAADNSPFTFYEFLANNLNNTTIKLNEASVPTLLVITGNNQATSSSTPASMSDLASLVGGGASASTTAFGNLFLQDCVSSVCRWLSLFGWPGGRRAISSPTDLRQEVQKGKVATPSSNPPLCHTHCHTLVVMVIKGSGKTAGKLKRSSLNQSQGPLLELLTHICGRLPPGIPLTPPPCSTHSEQVHLQYCIFSTILTFLR